MPEPYFQIAIDDQSVHVHLNVSTQSPHRRFYVCIVFAALIALVIGAVLFLAANHPTLSTSHQLTRHPATSSSVIVPLMMFITLPLVMILVVRRYVMLAFPSDQTLHCDRATLTFSRVRWLDPQNKHSDTHTWPLTDIAKMKYQSLASSDGNTIHGLRFTAAGRTYRVLPGLNSPDAERILTALKSLGLNTQ
jgi:hypothetical protein